MPRLQREREDTLRQAGKRVAHTDDDSLTAVSQKRRSRISTSHVNDNVVLSSKFVVEAIRERHEGDGPDSLWLEFPRADAEALEKRGIEILDDPHERLLRKKITIAKVAELASFPKTELPQKRTWKGKAVPDQPSLFSSPPDRGPFYHLCAKDFEWLEVYNNFCAEKKWPKLTADDLETTLTSLDVKKNELILAHLKSEIFVANKSHEGTAKRHEKDYFAMQKFIAYTPSTFDHLDHLNLGKSLGLTSQTAFDTWEYWKLKLQDNFYQPIIFPPAGVFDFRRISMLASWNMTTVNYAQRLRHDAERIRLMFDLLQRRNHVSIKVAAQEEELCVDMAELCMQQQAKSLPAELLNLVTEYMQELAPHTEPDPARTEQNAVDPVREWLESLLQAVDTTSSSSIITEPPAVMPVTSFSDHSIKPVIFPPLEIRPAPNIKVCEIDQFQKDTVLDGRNKPRKRLAYGRSEVPKNITFEHADNSCCENGPMDDEDQTQAEKKQPSAYGSRSTTKEEISEEEPLYMINNLDDSSVVLQEIYPSLKAAEFRSRLRSWKRTD